MNVKAHPAVRDLREMILRMGARAEAILETAIRSLRERDASLAERVKGEDLEIDRLDFAIDPPIYDAIRRNAAEIERSAPARLMEEYFKILRSGSSLEAFRALGSTGLLRHVSPEIPAALPLPLQESLEALDGYRRRFDKRCGAPPA